jgi:hypothetical protein
MFHTVGFGHSATAAQANHIIQQINLLNHNNLGFDGLLDWAINEVNQGERGQLVWNSLVGIYNQLVVINAADAMEVDAMGGKKKKRCHKSKVNGRMMMRDSKGRFCKMSKSHKRKSHKGKKMM